jgi:tight adherence protein C
MEVLASMPGFALVFALMAAGGVMAAFWGASILREPDPIKGRLSEFAQARPRSLEEIELSASARDRVWRPLFKHISMIVARRTPQAQFAQIRRNLTIAGNPHNLDAADFLGIKGCMALFLGIVGFLLFFRGENLMSALLAPLGMAAFGFYLPGLWLGQKMKSRRKEIQKALPDALDLLTISVEAGCGFDQALQKVTQKWSNALAKEFDRVLAEIRMGRARRDALRDMSQRCDVDDVNTFVSALIQADQLGVSLTRVLRVQSDQMRIRRRQRAEELAQQAPIKMLFPMVFLILPALFVVILGPAVPMVMRTLANQ